jgi:membrane fusion protein, multidrug efflux system
MFRRFICAVFFVSTLAGCTQKPPSNSSTEPPAIPVAHPVSRAITDRVDFTGRTDPIKSVNIVPRVTGYLVGMPFKEGSDVKVGDLLFEIDDRPYKAQLDQAEGQVKLYQAQLELAKRTLARDIEISKTPGAVSLQQLDQDRAAVDEADARVKAYQASTEVYKLNLSFTKVTAPIAGQVSRYYLTMGNLVNQDQTLLTTVVSLDPIYTYFDMDEPTLLRVRRAVNDGRIKFLQDGAVSVFMGVQGEDGYPHKGIVNFVNNQFNPTTGSISVRGEFQNPKPANGARLLSSGMFARIRLPLGEAHPAVLVIDQCIMSDQGLKKVYVAEKDKDKETYTVQERKIFTGSLQEDGLREVTEGLTADDFVVVRALQQVAPRKQIRIDVIDMPTLGPQDVGNQKSNGKDPKPVGNSKAPANKGAGSNKK